MKLLLIIISILTLSFLINTTPFKEKIQNKKDFQGKAYYVSKEKMDLGRWGDRLTEAQKKDIKARLKNRLEKVYTLTFNKEESFFEEEEKIDALSGATDSWGKNFAAGNQYKNVKTNTQIQNQEFYGKRFLVKDELQAIKWNMGSETKKIGNYVCFKATASIPTSELAWYSFSWDRLRNTNTDENGEVNIPMTEVEAWYTTKVPVSQGPLEYWGLPGLILEVSTGDTTMLCTKLILNPEERVAIIAPSKGEEITKKKYQETIITKMKDFRENRIGRNRG